MAFLDWWRENMPGQDFIQKLFADPNQKYRDQLTGYAQMVQGRETPQAQYSDFRDQQRGLINRLEAQSQGRGPSLAAQQLQAATDRNQRQAQGLAAGAGGPNAALAQFQAQQAGAQMGTQAAQDAAQARIQEQYNAQQLLGLNLHGGRESDESMNKFNADAILRMYGITDQAVINSLTGAAGTPARPSWGDRALGAIGKVAGFAGIGGGGGGGAPAASPTWNYGGSQSPGAGGGWSY